MKFKKGDLVKHKDLPWTEWGTFVCLSDDGSTVYYRLRGATFFSSSAPIDKMEFARPGNKNEKHLQV